MPNGLTLGQWLRRWREQNGMTLRDAERITGISNPYISQIENDKRDVPTIGMLIRFAIAYGAEPAPFIEKVVAGMNKKVFEKSRAQKKLWDAKRNEYLYGAY